MINSAISSKTASSGAVLNRALLEKVAVMADSALNVEEKTIQSRFGAVTVNLKNALFFPKGLIGLAEAKDFCLVDFPDGKMQQFKLLQCLNDYALSFVVLPLAADNNFIEPADMDECVEVSGVAKQEMLVLVIISVQRDASNVKIVGNLRAPVIVDCTEKLAIQYVFPNNKYNIRHVFS